jgi:hypothetical protein
MGNFLLASRGFVLAMVGRRFIRSSAGPCYSDCGAAPGKAMIQNAPNSFPSAMTTISAINGPTSPTIMISR